MQHDEVIWQVINHQFCSFKVKTTTQNFCRNEYNVTGLCNRQSCPLANSRYATVREHEGVLYLYMKTIERAHMPSRLWERIALPMGNYTAALKVIDRELEHWPMFHRHKCKQRLTKMWQYLIRVRRLEREKSTSLVPIIAKHEKKLRTRERKALAAAKLDRAIEKELLARLKLGVYGPDAIVNERQEVFGKVLDGMVGEREGETDADNLEKEMEEEEGSEDELEREFVEEESEEEDMEELFEGMEGEFEDLDEEDDGREALGSDDESEVASEEGSDEASEEEAPPKGRDKGKRKPAPPPPAKVKRRKVEIEYEEERETDKARNVAW